VNWDSFQEWCECHGGTWIDGLVNVGIDEVGPGCCGDDGSSDNWCIPGSYTSCYSGTYYSDADSNQYTCDCGTIGVEPPGAFWNIGGEPNPGPCCGDDPNENKITRTCNSWCTTDPNDDACCNALDKCVYSDDCYDSGTCISVEAYCDAGTWFDSDAGQTYCDNCLGPNHWSIGGEVSPTSCCGDDSGEYFISCQDNGEGYCSGSGDKFACCNSGTDCVSLDGSCRSDGYTTGSWVCNSGTWHDFVAPTTTDNADSAWTASDQTVTLTCDDADGSGCDVVRYCVGTSACIPWATEYDISGGTYDVSVTCPPDLVCKQYVRYQSKDFAGNWEGLKTSAETRIDKEKPTTTAGLSGAMVNPPWYVSDVDVTLSCDDGAGSGCSTTEYCVDQTPGSPCTPNLGYSGPVTISAEGTSYIRYRSADIVGNLEDTKFTEVKIDRASPTASIDPLPEWTNETVGLGAFFDVTWRGDDGTGSGIDFFDIQYRIIDRGTGGVVQVWADWLIGQASNPGTATFGPNSPEVVNTHNNRTFEFRVRATDEAGNVFDYTDNPTPYPNTNIDVAAPITSIDDPGAFQTSQTFSITIHATEGESGMGQFDCEIRGPAGGWRPITDNCDAPAENVYDDTLSCTVGVDGTYDFRCRGNDIASNRGGWSAVVSTTVDTTAPTVQIIEPTLEWTNGNQFTLTWQGSADVASYDVYYYETAWPGGPPANPSLWVLWNSGGPGYTTDVFGGGNPNLIDGQTYYINVTATDGAGILIIEINVTDQDGVEIEDEWIHPGSGIDFVNITSRTYDSLSGVKNNTIIYVVSGGTMPGTYFLECGEGPSPGYSRCSTGLDNPLGVDHIDYDDTTSLRYKVETRDRAGNLNETRFYFTVAHPLANFASSSYYIILGETKLVPVLVRNIQESPDDITLNLTNYRFAWFEYLCEPQECVIGGDKRDMDVLNVNPYEERTYYVRLLSSEPGSYALHLNATSALDPTLEDNHTLSLVMGYPVYFPGLGTWSIILLLILSGLIYSWISRKDF
jgi:hypothetical protein